MTQPCTEVERLEAIDQKLLEVRRTVGAAPNLATGDPGEGMAKTLVDLVTLVKAHIDASTTAHELVKTEMEARIKLAKIIAAAITGVVTTVAGVVTALYVAH